MGHAYIPGLKVSRRAIVQKKRILPIQGDVCVKEHDVVDADTIVARTSLPGKAHIVNVVNQLGIAPDEIKRFMVKKEGDRVAKGEPLAKTRPIIKWFTSYVRAPTEGIIESISEITGQIVLREPPQLLELDAYVDGEIIRVIPREGVVVETSGTFVQGIFGIGGEQKGIIEVVVDSPDKEITPELITNQHKGKIIAGGSFISSDALNRAKRVGVKGIIVGGVDAQSIVDILGYDVGVAITGTEKVGFSLIITEGFGRISMAKRTLDLLVENRGKRCSICGATQIRAGVIRPEVIIPDVGARMDQLRIEHMREREALKVGDVVRVIREPYFGRIGKVAELPPQLQKIQTESMTRILKVDFGDGESAIIPRTNVEIIEE